MKKDRQKDTRITLQQFLKWINAVQSGGEGKVLIQSGEVLVNGEVEIRRGRRLNAGDSVSLSDGRLFEVPS